MSDDLAYSRPEKTAQTLGELADDRHRFLDKKVLLTGDPETLAVPNGRTCFLDSLRLLVRICRNISVWLPPNIAPLRAEAVDLAESIAFGEKVAFLDGTYDEGQFDAILSIGHRAHVGLPWTTVNSNGFVARVTSGSTDISSDCTVANPVGSLAAACLGVGEVFKRLIRLRGERGEMLDGFTFSLLTYGTGDEPQPELTRIANDLLLVGGGAIGNGIAHLLSELPITGKVSIIDQQEFGPENLGTCILMRPRDVKNTPKAIRLAEILNEGGVAAEGIFDSFEHYVTGLEQYPRVVLAGLDNIPARHEVQRALWPDVVIDGAIGDFMCQVSRHPWAADVACLICLFQTPEGRSAEDVQREATGLTHDRLRNPDSVITEADVDAAPRHKQDFLRRHLGKRVCSVVQHAIAQEISEEKQRQDFEPSVPFVACFSACMVVTEMLAYAYEWTSSAQPRFQFDFLTGPAYGQDFPQSRRTNCVCSRRGNIDRVRARHGLPSGRN